LKELIDSITIEEIHKRLRRCNQLVEDMKSLQEIGKDSVLCQQILADMGKPIVHRNPELRMFYGGMVCMLNLIMQKENEQCPG
jgi:hypothetical protein